MKKRVIILCLAAAMLLLCSCGQVYAERERQEQLDALKEHAQTGVVPEFTEPSLVFADWSVLDLYTPFEPVGTRLSAESLTALTPSADYGPLIPFRGQNLYYATSDSVAGSKWGLSTLDGCVVLDPVCTSIGQATYYDETTYLSAALDVYILTQVDPAIYSKPDADIYSYEANYTRYALCALDGSWTTGFDYTGAFAFSGGVMAVVDSETNQGVAYDETGRVLYDTRDFDWLDQLDTYQLYNLASGAAVRLREGGYGLVLADGIHRFTATDFDYVETFRDGMAVATVYDETSARSGYIDQETLDWALDPVYESAGSFWQGQAVVRQDGICKVIDRTGAVVTEFGEGYCYLEHDSSGSPAYRFSTLDGEVFFYDAETFSLLTLDDQPAGRMGSVLYRTDGDDLRVSLNGRTFTVPSVDYLIGWCDSVILCTSDEDGQTTAVNQEGTPFLTTAGWIWLLQDAFTGQWYLQYWDQNTGSAVLVDTSGHELLRSAQSLSGPCMGLVCVSDEVSTGLKDLSGNWVLRIPMDQTD